MEGGQTQQAQPPPESTRWLQFAEWLRQQAAGQAEEAVSEASASDAEEASLPAEPAAASSSNTTSSTSSLPSVARPAGAHAASSAPHGSVSPSQLARHATLAPRLPDCRAEMRLTSDSCSRARQEMTVMLAAPGMPMHEAPVLTCKQASALMAAICEPLLSLPVGRLTRKLACPTKLQPTDDRGLLSLWLLPDDSLSLVWQSGQQLASPALEEMVGTPPSSSSSASSSQAGPSQLDVVQQSCSVALWEELAHFPAMAHILDDAPVVTIHMLRGDSSGRSFYIRVRDDVAHANLEAATAAVPDASRLLKQQQRAAASSTDSSGSAAFASAAAAAAAEADAAPRMYFWLTDKDLGRAVYGLGRLKSLLKRPPTLAKRSGVPERQLSQLAAWVQRADATVAAQQQQVGLEASAPEPVALGEGHALQSGSHMQLPGSSPHAIATPAGSVGSSTPSATRVRPTGLLSPLLAAPGLLLGQTMATATQVHGGMAAALLPPGAGPAAATTEPGAATGAPGGCLDGVVVDDESGALASSTVSATAAALYQDQRFSLVCPCTISVVVSLRMQAAGGNASALPHEVSARARVVAERQAKSAVDRSGRQRIEERLAEVVIRNIRSQRNRARAARQAQRDSAARAARQQQALELARRATGRTSDAPVEAPSSPATPVQPRRHEEEPSVPSLGGDDSPFALPATDGGNVLVNASSSAAVSTPAGAASPDNMRIAQPSSRAFSSPAALPMPPALLPGSRVTLGNLQSLLQGGPGLETASRQSSAASELTNPAGHPPSAAAGCERRSAPTSSGASHVSIADLADLLGKHAKLD